MTRPGFMGGPSIRPQMQESARSERRPTRQILARLSKYVLKYWYLFLLALVLTLLSNQLALLGPSFSGLAIDAISSPDGVDFAVVGENVGKMLLCYAVSAGLSYLLSALMLKLSQSIVYSSHYRF